MKDPLQRLRHEAYALAYQLSGKREDALDILQDATTRALTHHNVPARQSAEFKAWFFKVVRNRAIDQLRKQQRFTHTPLEADDFKAENIRSPEQSLEQSQLKSQIQSALMKLKLEQREIILLKDYHGFSYAEIAKVLDIPEGSVMSRLHRARLVLRKLLTDKD